MASLVTKKDLDKLVTNIGGPVVTSEDCLRGKALIITPTGEVAIADTDVSRSLGKFIGISLSNKLAGGEVEYQFLGPFKMSVDMGWTSGQPLYFDDSGDITNVPTTSSAGKFIQVIGVALSSDTIYIFREPAYPF